MENFFGKSYGIFTGPVASEAHVLFTGIAAREVSQEEWHPSQAGEWVSDSSYLLKIPYGDSRELVMDLLRWGSDAEVLAPKALREEIGAILEKAAGKYR
jgi:predicted DNA-binding transcriptional regulator YafY